MGVDPLLPAKIDNVLLSQRYCTASVSFEIWVDRKGCVNPLMDEAHVSVIKVSPIDELCLRYQMSLLRLTQSSSSESLTLMAKNIRAVCVSHLGHVMRKNSCVTIR